MDAAARKVGLETSEGDEAMQTWNASCARLQAVAAMLGPCKTREALDAWCEEVQDLKQSAGGSELGIERLWGAYLEEVRLERIDLEDEVARLY